MHMDFTRIDEIILHNFMLTPEITEYFKDSIEQDYYFLVVNNQFKTVIGRVMNDDNMYISLVRDPRILWILDRSTDDKNTEFFKDYFLLAIHEFTEIYKEQLSKRKYMNLIRFENLNTNFERIIRTKVFSYINGVDLNIKIPRCSECVNEYFTTDDQENNVWFGYKDQEKLDMVSEECREYIKLFGYKPRLTVEEIYRGINL